MSRSVRSYWFAAERLRGLINGGPVFESGDFLTITLLVALEGLLSADNALVIAVMVLGLPKGDHKPALHYGLVGAFVFRLIATLLAVYLIRMGWVKLLGGLYLLYLSYAHFRAHARSERSRQAPKAVAWFGMSAFWTTVMRVELVNLAFSIDSILVAVAMSPKLWVVLSGGILGIIMMRLVVGQLIALIERYPALVDGAFIIIAWVASKLIAEYLHGIGYSALVIPQWFSFAVIAVIFAASFAWARRQERRRLTKTERASRDLLEHDGS